MAAGGGVWSKHGAFVPAKVIAHLYDPDDAHEMSEEDVDAYLSMIAWEEAQSKLADQYTLPGSYSNDADAVQAEMEKAFRDWFDNLGTARPNLGRYIYSAYRINSVLRSGVDPDPSDHFFNETVADMDAIIQKSPGLPRDTVLYRGIHSQDLFDAAANGVPAGSVLSDRAYVSTTVRPVVAMTYIGQGSGQVLFRIRAPRGTRGAYGSWSEMGTAGFTGEKDVSEYVLPRGSQFRVTGTQIMTVDQSQVAVYDLEIVQ